MIDAVGRESLASYRVVFALLARQEMLGLSVSSLAQAAGVIPEEASGVLSDLEQDGMLGGSSDRRVLLHPDDLLDRWVQGYAKVLRPRLVLGRYRGPEPDPLALERRIESALGDETSWAFGGAAAAFRVTGTFRGETTVLHLAAPVPDFAARLDVRPDQQGPLVALEVPGPLAFEGVGPHLAHPLLVYTELQVPN